MAYTPPIYTPSGNLFGTTTTSTPYTYGNLSNNTSAYNLWGSTGNPYLIAGPTYTPGSGAPIVPQQVVRPTAPVVSSSGDSYTATAPSYTLSDGTEVGFDPSDPNNFRSQQTSGLNPYSWNWGSIGGGMLGGIGGAYLGGEAYNNSMLNTPEQAAAIPVVEKSQWANKSFASPLTNPVSGVDTSTLSGSTGTTNAAVTWSDNTDSGGNTTGTFTSDEMGSTSATDYGGGYYSVDVGDGDEVGYEDPGSSGGDSGGGGGGSYIATAATQSLGEEGLDVFNNWRDYMHSWHPTFTTSFGRYRVTAPKIVAKIDSKENSKELYKEIWDEYLLPIHNLIISKDDTNALIKYKVMVKELMNKYLKGDK